VLSGVGWVGRCQRQLQAARRARCVAAQELPFFLSFSSRRSIGKSFFSMIYTINFSKI